MGHNDPVAWRAYASDGSEAVYSLYSQARAAADEWNWSVEPLYRTPQPHATPGECTLTAPERAAIMRAMYRATGTDSETMWQLLERTNLKSERFK
jgi:hypothetical protein